jgi:hypothetical protein
MTAMRIGAILVVWVLCAGCGQVADAQAKIVGDLRIKDAIGDYEKAGRAHDLLDECVKAKLVAGAYADARDSADSQAWMARSQVDCREAAAQLRARLPAKS